MKKTELLHAKLPNKAWIDHTDFIQVFPPQPFSFAANFGYLARSSNECIFQIKDGAIVRLMPAEDDYVLAAVTGAADGSIKIDFPGTSALQLTVKKAEYLIGVAKLMAEGVLSKSTLLDHGDFHAAERELIRIRGIGPWTANYVLMRCLRAPTAFPIHDVGLHNAIKHLLNLDAKPSIEAIRELSSDWGEWKSYATFYLWRTLY